MKFLKRIAWILLPVVLIFVAFLLVMTISAYEPDEKELLYRNETSSSLALDTIRLVTWNIGYAGLDRSMDFFYDGGKGTRQTREQTMNNLKAVENFLKHHNDRFDIILLQEVDTDSKRSYRINEFYGISESLPQRYSWYALNYHVSFVPKPVLDPMGKVESGIAVFSRFEPSEVYRYSYPSNDSWPMRLFLLNRCFMTVRYPLSSGRELIVVNTHNSAYDDGSQRRLELDYLKGFLLAEEQKGNYLVVGGDWNHNPPGYGINEKGTEYFTPVMIDQAFMPAGWKWLFDESVPSNRYLNEPYQKGVTPATLLDFFLCSPNVLSLTTETLDLGFDHSDHNPVSLTIRLN